MAKKKKVKQDILENEYFFSTPIYKISKPDFLDVVKSVSEESVKTRKSETQLNEIYPVYMSGDLSQDERMVDFNQFVLSTAWNILDSQGYAMDYFGVGFSSMWMQEHHKMSGMDQHVHGEGSQIIAFYFTEVPEGGCQLIIHDPRPGKVQIDLPHKNMADITHSSRMVVIRPEVGDLFFTNAYLPHSFSRNASDEPMKFVHMNIFSAPNHQTTCDIDGPEII
jgi:Putative 2OG-Fe(II) oxygenase